MPMVTHHDLCPWKNLTAEDQANFKMQVERLGLQICGSDEAPLPDGVDLEHGFTSGMVFHRGVLWFDPNVATFEDLAHDLGHAFLLSPEARACFDDPEGDIENDEGMTMMVQWALVRATRPDYPLAETLSSYGYSFGYAPDGTMRTGEDWAADLEGGVIKRSELAAYCHLMATGLVQAPPKVRPWVEVLPWDDDNLGPQWAPAWLEQAQAKAIARWTPPAFPEETPVPVSAPPAQRSRRSRPG